MDYVEDKLSSQFIFNNPNVKEMVFPTESDSIKIILIESVDVVKVS